MTEFASEFKRLRQGFDTVRYLVPMAAEDDLFSRSDYHFPKPLIEIDGVPMVARFIDNILQHDPAAEFVFVVRAEHCRSFGLDLTLRESSPNGCRIVMVENATAGAACSALLAIDHIDDDRPLVVCNGDQIIQHDIRQALDKFSRSAADAGVITFDSVHPRWSYVRLDTEGRVVEAAEKRVVSRHAIAGFYYFAKGRAFVEAAKASILADRSHNGRFFISPTLNELILQGLCIESYAIPAGDYQSLFSPQRLENYERQVQALRLADVASSQRPVTVVIPMAGLGSRFSNAGYAKPKPFIDVAGKTMIERVMDNLAIPGARFVLIARQEHLDCEPETVAGLVSRGDVEFVGIEKVTEGAACTVLMAASAWNPDAPLLIANCDQIVDFDCADYVRDAQRRRLDGSILTFHDPTRDPKWSFARLNDAGLVQEVREKVAISDIATVGLYYFATARGYIDAAIDMIARNERVNNEFYVCPVYNHTIRRGGRVGVFNVPASAMHGIGTPDDLQQFLRLRYPQ